MKAAGQGSNAKRQDKTGPIYRVENRQSCLRARTTLCTTLGEIYREDFEGGRLVGTSFGLALVQRVA